MNVRGYWQEILDELYPDAAPHEVGLANAQAALARICGRRIIAPAAGIGECGDCGLERGLLLYGRVKVCWSCAFRRKRAQMFPSEEAG